MIIKVPYYSQFKDTKNPEWGINACGPTSLKMVLDYYKATGLTIDEIFQIGLDLQAYDEELGWYHHGLVNIAQSLGYQGVIRNWNIPSHELPKLQQAGLREEDLEIMRDELLSEGIFTLKKELSQKHPVIISIPTDFQLSGTGHLVTLIGYDERGFIAHDSDDRKRPGQNVPIPMDDFLKAWTKRAIIIYPKD